MSQVPPPDAAVPGSPGAGPALDHPSGLWRPPSLMAGLLGLHAVTGVLTLAGAALGWAVWKARAPTAWVVASPWVALAALALAFVASTALMRHALSRWLGPLQRLGRLDPGLTDAQQFATLARNAGLARELQPPLDSLRQAEDRLRRLRAQSAAVLEALDEAVLICTVDARIVTANEAAASLFGREATALVGRSVTDLLPALVELRDSDGLGGLRWRHRQLLWYDASGQMRLLDANLAPIYDAQDQRLGQVLTLRDMTEHMQRDLDLRALDDARSGALGALRRALEEGAADAGALQDADRDLGDIEAVSRLVQRLVVRMHEHSAQLDAIFALSPDGYVTFDAEHRVRYTSPGFTHLTGLASDMVVGLEQDVFLMRLRRRCEGPNDTGLLRRLQAGPQDERIQVTFTRPEHRVVSLALHEGRSAAVAQLLHLRDVTRENEVDRLKSEFVATAAHELRTPMVGIYGYSELLVTRDFPPDRQRQLHTRIHRQCELMLNILNEMLDLARMEARQGSDFQFSPVALLEVAQHALADFCPPPQRDAPRFEPDTELAWVSADAAKLERALRNLLSNAYKYSPEGRPVTVRMVRDDGTRRVGIEVADQGIGMTPEQLARVGQRFYRADESGSVLGTGLGVSLVREIASTHGGSVQITSEPGAGTRATLWLPLMTIDTAIEMIHG